MNLSDFITGLQTLRPYYNNPDGYHIGAEHDIFYAYTTDTPLSDEDYQKMVALGWFQEGSSSTYDPEEGWAAFT